MTAVGIPLPDPPELGSEFSGGAVCTHVRVAENLLLIQWPVQ
jgi:hypothetical protein